MRPREGPDPRDRVPGGYQAPTPASVREHLDTETKRYLIEVGRSSLGTLAKLAPMEKSKERVADLMFHACLPIYQSGDVEAYNLLILRAARYAISGHPGTTRWIHIWAIRRRLRS